MSQTTDTPPTRRVERSEVTTVAEQSAAGIAPPSTAEHTEQVTQSPTGVEHHERSTTDDAGLQHRESSVTDIAAEQRLRLERVPQVLWLVLGSVEALIGLRVLLKLIGANPDNAFARFIYDFSGLFVAPFVGLTGTPSSGGMVLEIPSIIAMLVFAGIVWGIVRLVLPLFSHPTTRSTSTYDRYRS